jgi:hypothetical protein
MRFASFVLTPEDAMEVRSGLVLLRISMLRKPAILLLLPGCLVCGACRPSPSATPIEPALELESSRDDDAWEFVRAFRDRDLEGEQTIRLQECITKLVPGRTYQDDLFFDFEPRLVRELPLCRGHTALLIIEANQHLPHPGTTPVRITVLKAGGQPVQETTFSTGHRCYLKGISVENGVDAEHPVIVLNTGLGPGPGPNICKQYYTQIDDRFDLIRLERSGGAVGKNDYSHSHFQSGPAIPRQTAAEWEADLAGTDRFRVLRALVWLGGSHSEFMKENPRPPSAEPADELALFLETRSRDKVLQSLRELVNSKDAWVAEAAKFALDARDESLKARGRD